jgi:hypothetical protein
MAAGMTRSGPLQAASLRCQAVSIAATTGWARFAIGAAHALRSARARSSHWPMLLAASFSALVRSPADDELVTLGSAIDGVAAGDATDTAAAGAGGGDEPELAQPDASTASTTSANKDRRFTLNPPWSSIPATSPPTTVPNDTVASFPVSFSA